MDVRKEKIEDAVEHVVIICLLGNPPHKKRLTSLDYSLLGGLE